MRNSYTSFNDQLSENPRSESLRQNSYKQNQKNEYKDNDDDYGTFSQQRSRSQISIPKSQQSASIISNQQYQNDDTVITHSNKTQTTIQNPQKKSQFHISTHSVYRRFEEPAILNKATNFLPLTNHISSSELLMNSGVYKKNFNDNDSTRATILMNLSMNVSDPSLDRFGQFQKPLKQRLDVINEEIILQKQRQDLQKNSFHKEEFQDQQYTYERRASEIVEDSIRQLEEERMKPKPRDIHIVCNPYEITSQDRLVKMIENERKRKEYETIRDAKELNQKKSEQANEILEFLGMKVKSEEDEETPREKQIQQIKVQPQGGIGYPSESQSEVTQLEPSAGQTQKSFFQRKRQRKDTTRVVDYINQMNSKTPQEQRYQMIKGDVATVVKSEKNFKSSAKIDFEDETQKKAATQKITQPTSYTSIQLVPEEDVAKKLEDHDQKKDTKKQYKSPKASEYGDDDYDENEDSKSVKHKVEEFVDRRTLKKGFRIPLRYNSAIIKRAFQKQGQTYISKWLSQSTFNQMELEGEEDIDQTVIRNAAIGQQVILLEVKPQVIKGRLNKFGKYKKRLRESHAQFEDIEEDEAKILETANQIDRKEVLKNRMRIQAHVESKKEKELANRGRIKKLQLELPESKWEQHQVLMGKRKVRFTIENDLYQPDLDVGPDTIFKNPTFFRGLQTAKGGSQSLISIGQSATSFAQIEDEQEPGNMYDVDQKYNFMSIFTEIYNGGDKKDSRFQNEWREFYLNKEKMKEAFERMDGLRYRYLPQPKIESDVRNEQAYEDMIKERDEDEKVWRPDDEPQTNPPDVLKDFIIEPNILVYSKNILDLDKNFSRNSQNKTQTVADARRQAKIGLADAQTPAHYLQTIIENKDKKGKTDFPGPTTPGGDGGERQLFDFMYKNPGDLPFVSMKQLQTVVEETEKQKLKLSEVEKALFEQTPIVPMNILTNKNMFLIKEVNEYENELRKKKQQQEKSKSQSKINSKQELENDKNHQELVNINKGKAQHQISGLVGAFNPINYQFSGKDVKTKAIMKGVEEIATQQSISIVKTYQNMPTANAQKTQTTIKNKPSPMTQTTKTIGQSANPSIFNIQSLQQISNEAIDKKDLEDKVNNIQIQQYNKDLEIKTIKDLNDMYTTPQQIISQTNKVINNFKKQGMTAHDFEFNMRKTGMSQTSVTSNPNEGKSVVKNNYYSDYGSYLTNTQYDYNIPNYYHNREAEQGLFYLSKHYRDYFEPARDVFAEKDGWDILDKFATNPKNVNAVKPSVHTYGEAKREYNEDDILTAFHGISVMNNHNKLFNDVEQRNQDNFRRRIYYNQSQ